MTQFALRHNTIHRWFFFLILYHSFSNSETNANKRYSVRVGSSTHEKGGKVYKVKETILHPEYDTYTVDFDVALIRLAEPISFTACTVRPIQIVDEGVKTLDGAMLTVTGWGSRTVNQIFNKHLDRLFNFGKNCYNV